MPIKKKSQIGTDAGLSAPFPNGVGSAPAAGEGRERRWWGFALKPGTVKGMDSVQSFLFQEQKGKFWTRKEV